MVCPICNGKVHVLETRHTKCNDIYRLRQCLDCGVTFYTAECLVSPDAEFMADWRDGCRGGGKKRCCVKLGTT